jgi:hypothetical protein
MPSTLTAGGKDGKQSKNFERNPRKAGFCEILLLVGSWIVLLFAQCLSHAQSIEEGLSGLRVFGLPAGFGDAQAAFAGLPAKRPSASTTAYG